ncbi:MAG: glycosyltransferase family 9 protein [Bacteroidota bacterium]|jgi:ADP-heptose:LPS heptosyltransferase|nr:glycosyltransferase family 9 protein [Bacteroidota bacterium]
MKILVIRFSSIGDIVLTTPAIRCLKQQLPHAEIHFLCKLQFKAVTEANPYIDRFHYYNGNLSALIETLKAEQFNYIIDLHKNFRSYKIRWALRTQVLAYQKLSIQKFLLTRFHINMMPGRHISLRCLDALAPLNVFDDGKGLDYFIPADATLKLGDLPASHSAGYIAIVIGASYFTKKLPIQKLQQLCKLIQYPIVLVGGKEDVEAGNAIATVDVIKVYNACGKFSLHESADIVRQSHLVIAHDTGLLYIACAFKKRVFAIWGGTSPALDVEPYYGSSFVKQSVHAWYKNYVVPNISCQPCSNFGTATCPKKHFHCMQWQNVEQIAQEALQILTKK